MNPETPDTRTRLIEAATTLVFERGYNAVGVQEVCERAQVKKGSFYHFFPSKQALVVNAIERRWQTFKLALEGAASLRVPPLERFGFVFATLHQQYEARLEAGAAITGCPFGSLALEVSAHDPTLRAALQAVFDEWTALFEGVFQEALERGDLPAEGDPRRGGAALLAYLEGVLLLVKNSQNPELLAHLAPTRMQLVAFAVPAPSPRLRKATS
jgi:TetR/AcrR family transcriptional repressor of nem operon